MTRPSAEWGIRTPLFSARLQVRRQEQRWSETTNVASGSGKSTKKGRRSMFKIRSILLSLLIAAVVAGCASLGSIGETSRGLVGAWIVTASRPAGVGKNLL